MVINMFKDIIVTESSYNDILAKIQKITNKYCMIHLDYKWIEEDKCTYRRVGIGFHKSAKKLKFSKYGYRRTLRFYKDSKFLRVTKHPFAIGYENGFENTWDKESWNKFHCVIHLSSDAGSAHLINLGDKVRLFPFGFKIIQYAFTHSPKDIAGIFSDNKIVVTKDVFVADLFKGKINLNEEIEKRNKHEEEFDEMKYKQLIEDEANEFDKVTIEDDENDPYDDLDWEY